MSRIAPHLLADLKRRHPVSEAAGQWVRLRRGSRSGWMVGPCPLCSQDPHSRTAGRFECSAREWVCAVCCDGGDIIRLLMLREGLDFPGAVAALGGVEERRVSAADVRAAGRVAFRPGHDCRPPPDYAHEADAFRAGWDAAALAEAQADAWREAERQRLHAVWCSAQPAAGSPVQAYFERRGLDLPPRARLRYAPDYAYFHGEEEEGGRRRPRIIHRGPAMLAAAIGNDGRFHGLHATWLDLDRAPKYKAEIADPETGELLPAKKARGSTKARHLELVSWPSPRRLYLGEGLETVCTIWSAMRRLGKPLEACAFWTSIDLHNLGGPHRETIPHPDGNAGTGRRKRIPGPAPEFSRPAIAIPPSVSELVLLGDGDSDPALTRTTLARARARFARPGLAIAVAMAPAGCDFNDLVMESA